MRGIAGNILISCRLVNLITMQDSCLWKMAERTLMFGFHTAAKQIAGQSSTTFSPSDFYMTVNVLVWYKGLFLGIGEQGGN